MSVTDKINKFIKEEGGGNTRDALNVALAKIDSLASELEQCKKDKDYWMKEFLKLDGETIRFP